MPVRVEVCVEDAAGALAAEHAGADRVELCSALIVGGLTPSLGCVVSTAQRAHRIGVQVLIRPREGDFVFSTAEVDAMVTDIIAIRKETSSAAVPVGFVIGALTDRFTVDKAITAELLAACEGAPTTFHRAFDLVTDLPRALETLATLGIDRVLTSGGARRAGDGAATLAALIARAAGRICVMPGGSIRADNAARIVAATGATEIHFRAPRARPNHLSPRRPRVPMAAASAPSEESRPETSGELVREIIGLVRGG